MKYTSAKIRLTPEQCEQLKPLYEALKDQEKLGGVGATFGQLAGLSFESIGSGFTYAGFAVLDHVAAVKVTKLIKKELKRMALEESTAAMVADAAKKAEAEAGS